MRYDDNELMWPTFGAGSLGLDCLRSSASSLFLCLKARRQLYLLLVKYWINLLTYI